MGHENTTARRVRLGLNQLLHSTPVRRCRAGAGPAKGNLANMPMMLLKWMRLGALALLLPGGAGLASADEAMALQPLAPVLPGALPGAFVEVPATLQTLQQLRAGGYVLFLRHGATDNTRPDRTPAVDLDDCSTQRPLNAQGWAQQLALGQALRRAHIPVTELRISPLCRTRDSARAAFPGLKPVVDPLLIYAANLTEAEKAPVVANTRRWLSVSVPPGQNRVLLAHASNLMEVMGYFPQESMLVVLRPKGEQHGFEYVASIPHGAWARLLP